MAGMETLLSESDIFNIEDPVCDDTGPVDPVLHSCANINVHFEDVKTEYEKDQKKTPKTQIEVCGVKNRQMIIDGKVHCTVSSSVPFDYFTMTAYVRRTSSAASCMTPPTDWKGELRDAAVLEVRILEKNYALGQLRSVVDLGEAYYTVHGDPVFQLSTTRTDERNVFEIVLSIHVNGEVLNRFFVTKPFIVKSKEKINRVKRKHLGTGEIPLKRSNMYQPLEDDDSTSPSVETTTPISSPHSNQTTSSQDTQGRQSVTFSPLSDSSSSARGTVSEPTFWNPDKGEFSSRLGSVHVEELAAEKAFIRELNIYKCIAKDKGDIAYHVKLERQGINENWTEGTVVAFVQGPLGDTRIEELSPDNLKDAKLAGVISRSAYVEAHMLAEGEPADAVCIMGAVKVNMVGDVSNGEPVYASPFLPGTGISKSNLQLSSRHDSVAHVMLGQALERKAPTNHNEVHQVMCLISLFLGLQSRQIMDVVKEEKEKSTVLMNQTVKREKKKIIRQTTVGVCFSVLFLILLGVMLREMIARSTAFQYYLCEKGAISDHQVCLKVMTPLDDERLVLRGYPFKWETLKKKLGITAKSLHEQKGKSEDDYEYFLDVDHCAYVRLWFRNKRESRILVLKRSEVFAIPENKNKVKVYHMDDEENKWKPMNKTKIIRNCSN